MEQLTLDAGGGMDPGPHLLVESVNPSDDEEEEDDFERQTPPAGGQPLVARGDATDSDGDSPESSLIVISLDPERKSSMRKRSGSHTPPRMGREASPFFNVLLVFSVVVSVLATFTIGLGAKVELQLGNSHTQWSASLWWGAIVILCLALFYLLVHMSIQKGWQVSRYSFMLYQVLCLIALAVTIAAIDRSYATYKNVLSVQTDQCVFVNQEGTYVPATSCYDPCREYLNRTLGQANPPSVCCCCSISLRDDNEDNFIYFTRVKDCSDVDASESELRYLTICYMVMLVMQFMELLFCLVVQFSCCGVIAPWRYMLLNASGRYSIN